MSLTTTHSSFGSLLWDHQVLYSYIYFLLLFTVATCLTPTTGSIARSTNIYPSGSTVDYNKEVNIECQYGSIKINRTLYCSYNVMSGVYELLGDAPECPGKM